MKRFVLYMIAILILLPFFSCGKKAVNPGGTVEGVPVGVIKAEKRDITVYYETSATIKASDVRTLSFPVPGKIVEMSKENGERIKTGEVLAMLDRSTYESALRAAESGLEAARSGLKAVEQQKNASANQLKDAENRFDQIEKDYQRFKKLHDDKVITDKEFEEIELGYKSAALGVESARSALKMAESQVVSASEGVKGAMAQRDMAKKQFDDATMISPFNGTVNGKISEVGSVAGGGMDVYEVVADGAMKIEGNLPERYLNAVSEGSPVLVSIPAIECSLSPQTVSLVHREINRETGNFGVTIDLKDVDGCLRHGMFAHLSFELDKRENALALPVIAILESTAEKFVYVVEGDKAVKKVVQTGLSSKDYIEILSGLQGGENVILSGNRYVIDGSIVRVVSQEATDTDKES